jgi:hypothetical protein
VEFGNPAHIAAFACRRPRRVRPYDRVKRPTPLLERDIPAVDEAAGTGRGEAPSSAALPSLWDVLAVQTQTPEQAPPVPAPSPLPSIPRQSGLWE